MPGPLDWWNRIRRVVGPPGAPATRAGVPADVDAARRAELAEVFAHVDRLEAELRVIETECDDRIAAMTERVERELGAVLGDARERAAKERAVAGAHRRSDVERRGRELRATAESEATSISRRTFEVFPALVDRAVAEVRAFAIDGDVPSSRSGPEQ